MKKAFLVFILLLVSLPGILAIDITVEKQSRNEVYIPEVDNPIIFDLKITNNGDSDSFNFYNLVGFEMSPDEIKIEKDESKEIRLSVSPIGEIKQRGGYGFTYYIKGKDSSEIKEVLSFRIVDFQDLFEIGAGSVDPNSNSINLYVLNREDYGFKKLDAKFISPFFEIEETFSLGPNQRREFTIQLNKEDFKELTAGYYTLKTEISWEREKANIESVINFLEKDLLVTTKKSYGIIINTEIIEKKNEGNVVVVSETVMKKNIVSRLFTSFNPEPISVDRTGSTVYYFWKNSVQPGEVLRIESKTNWLWPIFCIIFILAVVIFAKKYSESNLKITKRISFVRAKGGEFALKVSLNLKARKYVEKIVLVDRLPPLVKLYEHFGKEAPSRIDEKNRRVEWNFDKLEEGEIRIVNYIIYSKVGVLGKFALPQATAIYEREGKISESVSNRAFYMSGQRQKELE